jgi:uncharacterized RDD family membrane protein YckC
MDSQNPYAPPSANVQDVYVPGASLEPADRGIRLAAYIVDTLIVSAMVYGPFLAAFAIGAAAGPGGDAMNTGIIAGMILGCVGFIVWAWLMIRGVARSGQSIAKKMLGIRVVRTDGSPATLGRIFWLRNVVNGLISVVPLYFLIDVLFIFAEDRQCLHDKLADTIVVKA